jgi:phage gp36-like protein
MINKIAPSIEAALAEASGQMDLYIGTRNTLPLSGLTEGQTADLARIACDIARYRLYADRATEEVRTVEDYPTYVDVSGEGAIMVPIGGGTHQERAWACPAIDGRAARTVWLED